MLRICKQDAYANRSASILIVTAEVAMLEHSGATHCVSKKWHPFLFKKVQFFETQCIYRSYVQALHALTADDRNRIGAILRKALRRGVTHTDFYIEKIIDSVDRKLFSDYST